MADDTRITSPATAESSKRPNNNRKPAEPASKEEASSLLGGIDEVDALPPRMHYGVMDFAFMIISIVTYIADLTMDIIVCVYFYHLAVNHGIYHYWYFGLTLAFILLPSLTMTGFSFRWYLMDADNENLDDNPSMCRWILRLVVLMLQIAPILRYIDAIRYGIMSRYYGHLESKAEDPEEREKARRNKVSAYTKMVYEDADATLLRLFECFMESAPQLVLQIYILLKDRHAAQLDEKTFVNNEDENRIIKISIFSASVFASLISLAWSLVVYHRSLRYTCPEKNNINCGGSVLQFLWHFMSVTARVFALSLFATAYPRWIGVVCGAHFVLMATWVVLQRTEACVSKFEEFIFAMVLGAIYIFSFFNAKDERTRWKYLFYYTFCFFENTALIAVYARDVVNDETSWYRLPGIVVHYITFFSGVLFMLLYYGFFHPTGIKISADFFRRWKRERARRKQAVSRAAAAAAGGEEGGANFLDLRKTEAANRRSSDNQAATTPTLTPTSAEPQLRRQSMLSARSSPSIVDEPDLGEESKTSRASSRAMVCRSLSEPVPTASWPPPSTVRRTLKAMGAKK